MFLSVYETQNSMHMQNLHGNDGNYPFLQDLNEVIPKYLASKNQLVLFQNVVFTICTQPFVFQGMQMEQHVVRKKDLMCMYMWL